MTYRKDEQGWARATMTAETIQEIMSRYNEAREAWETFHGIDRNAWDAQDEKAFHEWFSSKVSA